MVLKHLWNFLKSLEQWEKYEPSNFWLCSIGLYFSFSAGFGALFPESPSYVVIEQVCISRGGGGGEYEPKSSTSQLRGVPEIKSVSKNSKTSLEPKEFREMLARYFPDWDARLSVEKQQAIIYNKATKKLKAYKNLNPLLKNPEKLLTDDERFAIDYFHGRGTCEKFQDPKTQPNLYNTRQTFLKKMENQEMRQKFLESYNRRNPIKEN